MAAVPPTVCSLRLQIVHDASKDGRFMSHPLVMGEEHARFYAGAPLVASSGHRIGALCAPVPDLLS